VVAPKGAVFVVNQRWSRCLLAAGILGDSLSAFADSMLCKFSGQKQPDGGLDLAGADGRLLVVVRQAGRLIGDTLEDIIHKRIHDTHGLARNTRIGMNLLKDLVDVDRIALLSLSLPLFLGRTINCRRLSFSRSLLAFLCCWNFRCHVYLASLKNCLEF